MDTAVALVQAYLNANGYFTVVEYPVLEAVRHQPARSVTDLDVLAFRFAGAGHEIIRERYAGPLGTRAFKPDPALGFRADSPWPCSSGTARSRAGPLRVPQPEILMQRQLTLLLALVLPSSTRGQAAPPAAVVAQFHGALAAGDSSGALALLLPEVVIFEAGGVEASRDEYRQHHLPADMAFSRATTRAVDRVWVDSVGDVAWVLTESRTTGTFRERPVDARGVETMLLRRTAAGWRITHIHWSSRRS